MTLISLAQALVPLQPHPTDARSKVLSAEHLRQVAALHRRTLPDLPEALPASVQALQPPPPPAPWADLAGGLETLATLCAQIVALQERLTELSQLLSGVAVAASASPAEPTAVPEASPAAPVAPRALGATASSAKLRRAPMHILPLVEYATEGGYVVICPKQGLLPLEPDTPQWFAWLATQSSFRFVGRSGHLTAHRESQRSPRAVWRAHRQMRNHTYNHRLGSTQCLTISALEQAAAALQAHLT